MALYVQVSSEDIERLLQLKGFQRTIYGNEVVYEKPQAHCNRVIVKVYTSIAVGNPSVRKCGQDAIKVCTVYERADGRIVGIGKFPRILRVGTTKDVLIRILERIAAAEDRGREWLAQMQAKQVLEA